MNKVTLFAVVAVMLLGYVCRAEKPKSVQEQIVAGAMERLKEMEVQKDSKKESIEKVRQLITQVDKWSTSPEKDDKRSDEAMKVAGDFDAEDDKLLVKVLYGSQKSIEGGPGNGEKGLFPPYGIIRTLRIPINPPELDPEESIVNGKKVKLLLKDYSTSEHWIIKKGFPFNGASIPKFARGIIGEPYDLQFQPAALTHDCFYSKEHRPKGYDRSDADFIFYHLLRKNKVSYVKARTMYTAVVLAGWAFYE